MIKYKTFLKVLEVIKKQKEKEKKFCKALETLIDGYFVPQMSTDLEAVLIELVEECFNDKFESLNWFIYENDFGKKKFSIDDKVINSPERMYNWFVKNKE